MIRVDVGNDQKSLIHTHHIYPNIKWPLFTVFNFQENNCTEHFQPCAQLYKKEILHFIPVIMTYEHEWVSMKSLPVMSWCISNMHWALLLTTIFCVNCGNRRQQLVTFAGHITDGWLRKTRYTICTKQTHLHTVSYHDKSMWFYLHLLAIPKSPLILK
jgi:hypothetical protein